MRASQALMVRRIEHGLAGLAIAAIILYRSLISPVLPKSCRFSPTCSEYALEAVRKHGILRGATLIARRILKCHPLGGSGFDPVP